MFRSVRRVVGITTIGLVAAAVTGLGAGVASAAQAPPPVAMITNLTGQSTSVKLDAGFVEALGTLGVEPSPAGNAKVADGSATFPITGGNVTVYKPGDVNPYVQGKIEHDGSGLNLTKGDTKVTIEDFVIDPGDPAVLTGKVLANGEVAAESVKLFDLNGSTLKPIMVDSGAGTATLTGTTVTLSSEAAQALNGAFKTDAIEGGTTIGIATIVVNTKSGDMPMPKGGVDTGAGGTDGTEDTGLIVGGALLLLGAGAVVLVARRRRADQS